ncbi:class I SAM-dependent methyltransferase [Bacillus mycoides]|uniref:class I SAM-dependent methyltransferase n=1 Tax=Bacillus mycoides TaxID=1405 RepID=UPI002E1AB211|nr:class I SAM-dependent methyltransferase [Bacillus mycoides]MED1024354.1 class I SAM-dependent methyltransferase [Bacillus mycoides]MED1054625.1 class I SAM-dependent methyltransferase [Bacillus mycoides]
MSFSSKEFAEVNQTVWNKLYKGQNLTGTAVRSVPNLNGTAPEIIEKNSTLLHPNSKILELGCGHGTNLLELARVHECTGIDISKEALQMGEKRAEKAGVSIRFIESDFYSLPFEDSQFDCVIGLYSLQFNDWNSALKVFKEIRRVLKKDGYLIFMIRSTARDMPTKYKILDDHGLTFISYEEHEYGMTYHHYTEEEIRILTEGFGKIELYEETKHYTEEKKGKRVWWAGVYRKE